MFIPANSCLLILVMLIFALGSQESRAQTNQDVENRALIVIDMQPGFVERINTQFQIDNRKKISAVVDNQVKAIELAKSQGLPIVFIEMENETQEYGQTLLPLRNAILGYEKAKVIKKSTNGAFSDGNKFKPQLLSFLEQHEVKELIITGANGSACVRATVNTAVMNNFSVLMFSNGIIDFNSPDFVYPYRYFSRASHDVYYEELLRVSNLNCNHCSMENVTSIEELKWVISGENWKGANNLGITNQSFLSKNVSSRGHLQLPINWSHREQVLIAVRRNGSYLSKVPAWLRNDKEIVATAVKEDPYVFEKHVSEQLKDDEDVVLAMMSSDQAQDWHLDYASERLKQDKEFIIKVVKVKPGAFCWASESIRNDIEVLKAVVNTYEDFLPQCPGSKLKEDFESIIDLEEGGIRISRYIDKELLNTRSFLDKVLPLDGSLLSVANQEFQGDKELAFKAVSSYGRALFDLSEELQNDPEFVLAAVKSDGIVLKDLKDKFKNDPRIVLAAVEQNGYALRYASDSLRSSKEIALEATRNNSYAYRFIGEELKSDLKLAQIAISDDWRNLQYVSSSLKNDKEVAMIAVKENGSALEYTSEGLRKNLKIAYTAVKSNPLSLRYLDQSLRADFDLVKLAINNDQSGLALSFASEDLRNNKELVINAVRRSGYALKYASRNLRNDKDIVLEAIANDPRSLKFASSILKGNLEVAKKAIESDGRALQYASNSIRDREEIVSLAISYDAHNFEYASSRLKNSKSFSLPILKDNGLVLKYLSEELRSDKEIVLAAVRSYGRSIIFASEELKNDPNILSAASLSILNDGYERIGKNGCYLKFFTYVPAMITYLRDERSKRLNRCSLSEQFDFLQSAFKNEIFMHDEVAITGVLSEIFPSYKPKATCALSVKGKIEAKINDNGEVLSVLLPVEYSQLVCSEAIRAKPSDTHYIEKTNQESSVIKE